MTAPEFDAPESPLDLEELEFRRKGWVFIRPRSVPDEPVAPVAGEPDEDPIEYQARAFRKGGSGPIRGFGATPDEARTELHANLVLTPPLESRGD